MPIPWKRSANRFAKTRRRVTLDNLISTLTDLRDRRGSIMQQSLVNLFKKLNRAFANNDAYRLGRKIIREYAISKHGGFYGYTRDIVAGP